MNTIDEIVKWADTLKGWQKEAIRRLLKKHELSTQDFEEILLLLKAENNLIDPAKLPPTPQPLISKDIAQIAGKEKRILLKSMHSVENVNALEDKQRLNFSSTGITVIYGNNATGKSGYSRVLKKACRARDESDPIYSNIFKRPSNKAPAKAKFDLEADEDDFTIEWEDETPSPISLTKISVFDSKCARFYIDKANDVFYLPYGFDIFQRLVELCRKLKRVINIELDETTPTYDKLKDLQTPKTKVSSLIDNLKPETDIKEIEELAKLSDEELSKISKLTKIIEELKRSDPKIKADNIRRLNRRIERLTEITDEIATTLSENNTRQLETIQTEYQSAKKASLLSSEEAFTKESLPGVGSEPWKLMFEAARRYSEEFAYTTLKFPVLDDESRCVFCQQLLNKEAKDRLNRFNEFITKDIQKRVEKKQKEFNKANDKIKDLDLSEENINPDLLDEIKDLNRDLYKKVEIFIASSRNRQEQILNSVTNTNWINIPSNTTNPKKDLEKLSKKIEAEALEYDKTQDLEYRSTIEEELTELNARKTLSLHKSTVKGIIEKLKICKKLRNCTSQANTKAITKKQSELMKLIVTKALSNALTEELNELGIDYLLFTLIPSGELGKTYHQLHLENIASDDVHISSILSEGEHRTVALASFLAELRTSSNQYGIVFDDPVCSLDHLWMNNVAKRLVQEGKTRQVIVFTHDITFLLALESESVINGISVSYQTIQRRGKHVGSCINDVPWHAMSVNKRLGYVRKLHQETSKFYSTDPSRYEREASLVYGLLRETWERAVEEVILGHVIQRFRNSVETTKLRKITFENNDFISVTNGMTKCSKWMVGHDQAAADLTTMPDPDEVNSDINILYNFVKNLRNRQDFTEKSRRKLVT
ncbi:hypothetical protein CEE37_14025 [candidate division LCP-89 bacterium B3_LCP]|uniref:Protein CR006 P-loop domain-containing protein n=1 Tax=candidate division LCP-89 bacterium B3_LCP TaxID=2012998 RepID=A0A532UQK5_UNCL8|nr:MAG: hypothetical protein CEE37_14025 [candidate division LCP-89 bacterium B3_LCP]